MTNLYQLSKNISPHVYQQHIISTGLDKIHQLQASAM